MRTDTPTLTCASDTEDRASSPNTSTRHCKKYALRIIVTSRVTRTDEHERKNCCGWAPTLMIVNPPADGKLLGRLLHNEYVTVGGRCPFRCPTEQKEAYGTLADCNPLRFSDPQAWSPRKYCQRPFSRQNMCIWR